MRSENALQDTLRLLTLWFKFGAHDDVSHAIASGFSAVEVDTWLEVIPQVSYPRSSLSTTGHLFQLDHCAHPNSQYKHQEEHYESTHRRWQTSSAGTGLSSHRGLEVTECATKGRCTRHYGPNEAAQSRYSRAGASSVRLIGNESYFPFPTGPCRQPRAYTRRDPMA